MSLTTLPRTTAAFTACCHHALDIRWALILRFDAMLLLPQRVPTRFPVAGVLTLIAHLCQHHSQAYVSQAKALLPSS